MKTKIFAILIVLLISCVTVVGTAHAFWPYMYNWPEPGVLFFYYDYIWPVGNRLYSYYVGENLGGKLRVTTDDPDKQTGGVRFLPAVIGNPGGSPAREEQP